MSQDFWFAVLEQPKTDITREIVEALVNKLDEETLLDIVSDDFSDYGVDHEDLILSDMNMGKYEAVRIFLTGKIYGDIYHIMNAWDVGMIDTFTKKGEPQTLLVSAGENSETCESIWRLNNIFDVIGELWQ